MPPLFTPANPVIRILNLTLAVILVAVMAVIWIGYNPAGLTATAYVERHQAMIRMLNVSMPVLGAATILLTFGAAYLRRSDRPGMYLLVASAFLLIGAGLITRFCNQPINALVATWNPAAPPGNWEQLRDQWWQWHIRRTVLAIVALALLLVASFRKPARPRLP